MKPYRVVVTGSRTWTDQDTIFGALDLIAEASRRSGSSGPVPATDPGHAGGAQVYVFHPKCLCGDAWVVHKPNDDGVRGACSHSGCGCRVYRTESARA